MLCFDNNNKKLCVYGNWMHKIKSNHRNVSNVISNTNLYMHNAHNQIERFIFAVICIDICSNDIMCVCVYVQ